MHVGEREGGGYRGRMSGRGKVIYMHISTESVGSPHDDISSVLLA